MREVSKNLYCGSEQDFYMLVGGRNVFRFDSEIDAAMPEGWAVVHACKEPFHRIALGYTGKGAPKGHSEYLWALRDKNRLVLNMVDAPKPEFFDMRIIDVAISFIDWKLSVGKKVLVHCNEGKSRSCAICLLYLASLGISEDKALFELFEAEFMERKYPEYAPGAGIRAFMQQNWNHYCVVVR